MSDFLTNLVARTVGAPSLRPRVRSRFEPPAAADPPALVARLEQSSPAATGVLASVSDTVPGPTRARMTQQDLSVDPPRRTATDAPLALRSEPQRGASRESGEPESPEGDHGSAPPLTTVARPPVQPEAPEQRRTPAAAAPPHVLSQARNVIAPARPLTESVIETREIVVRETATPATTHPQSPQPPALPRHRHDERPPRIELPVPGPETRFVHAERRSPGVPHSRPEAPAPSEPVIQVSIGRVEVRAVTPQPAAKQGRAPRPGAMTIDDYAARRNARGRR
jgi:hypothetical protein